VLQERADLHAYTAEQERRYFAISNDRRAARNAAAAQELADIMKRAVCLLSAAPTGETGGEG
jgi:hypothetical protein